MCVKEQIWLLTNILKYSLGHILNFGLSILSHQYPNLRNALYMYIYQFLQIHQLNSIVNQWSSLLYTTVIYDCCVECVNRGWAIKVMDGSWLEQQIVGAVASLVMYKK